MDRQEMKQKKMMGAILPGNSTVELREFDMPKPGHGQVVVKAMATTICGSDIRCIYSGKRSGRLYSRNCGRS